HVATARAGHATGEAVEMRILIGMQPYHFCDRNGSPGDEDKGRRNRRKSEPARSHLDERHAGHSAEYREWRQHEDEMANAVVHRRPQRDRERERQQGSERKQEQDGAAVGGDGTSAGRNERPRGAAKYQN